MITLSIHVYYTGHNVYSAMLNCQYKAMIYMLHINLQALVLLVLAAVLMVCVHVLLATLVLIVVSVLQDTTEQLMELVNVRSF